MSEGTLIAQADLKSIMDLDETVRKGHREMQEAEDKGNQTVKAFVQARMLQSLREQLKGPLMQDIMSLRGTPLGFLTDRDGGKTVKRGDKEVKLPEYSEEVTRDCVVAALFEGYRLVNNEFNILASKMYPAKNGVHRQIEEFPGLTDLETDIGVPEVRGKCWVVTAKARWKVNGEPMSVEKTQREDGDYRIMLPMYSTDKPATVLGKAESQLFRAIWKRLTGSELSIAETTTPDPENDPDVVDGEFTVSEGTEEPAADISSLFADCKTIGQCNDALDNFLQDETVPADVRDAARSACEERCGEIRSKKRGTRSNTDRDAIAALFKEAATEAEVSALYAEHSKGADDAGKRWLQDLADARMGELKGKPASAQA